MDVECTRSAADTREYSPMFRATILSILTAGAVAGSQISFAQQRVDLPLATDTLEKIVNAPELARMMAADPAGRYRVIVQYDRGALGTPNAGGTKADDSQYALRNHGVQDSVLTEVFGSSDAIVSGPLSQQYGTARFDYSPSFVISLTAAEIDRMAASGRVLNIQPDVPVPPTLDQSTVQVNMSTVWTAGGTGNGRTVAILDTGVKKAHEFITAGRVVSEACYNVNYAPYNSTSRCPGAVEESTAAGSGDDCAASLANGCSHGTHVAGIAAGSNTNRQAGEPLRGMAYQANIIAVNIFSLFNNTGASSPQCQSSTTCVLSYTSDQLKGLERVYALRSTYSIDAVNMSLGGGANSVACDSNSLAPIIGSLRTAGIATVIAAGNDGLDTQVGAPGCISDAITVASSLDNADTRSSFSNWGSLVDVVAPGSNITSSVYGSSVGDITSYSSYNGTSMATPHVAGAFAALRSLYPTKTVTEIETALESTGVSITSAGTTKPRIAMAAACNSLGGGTCGGGGGPANDNFANATVIASLPYATTGTNVGATSETGEPTLSSPNNSVWYRVVLASAATLHVDTAASGLDTYIGLYSGAAVNALTEIATNDDFGGNLTSQIEASVPAGTYYIAVDGFGSNTGSFNLNVSSTAAAVSLVAAVLPSARAVQAGTTATAFATIVNASASTATSCSIALPSALAGTTFLYQTTNGSNQPTGSPNTPVSIAASGSQGFYFALTSTGAVSSHIPLVFDCANTSPATSIYGVNTFLYTASSSAISDLVAVAATFGNTGYITIPGTSGQQIATVAAVNIGATESVTVNVTEQAIGGVDPNMPANLLICRTDSVGTCLTGYVTSTTFTATAGQTYYFAILAQGAGTVADNPATNRAHVYFRNGGSQVVGATSVAVRTQ